MAVSLAQALAALDGIAPLRYAESWDNVGLLVEPRPTRGRAAGVGRILLAIDATEAVVAEAVRRRCALLVAYHPPIFTGLKALRASDPGTRAILAAVHGGVAIYSPHTALDAAPGGLNDWLAAPFGRVRAEPLRALPDAPPGVGQGRLVELPAPRTLRAVATMLKRHLRVPAVRVAPAARRPDGKVRSIALVAGAGGSVLLEALARRPIDLLFTGEMRHHDA